MKAKSVLLSLALIIVTATATYAQGFHLGIKGGMNGYKIDNESFNQGFKYGYNLGGFAEINFTKHFGIQPEVMWNQSNVQTTTNFNIDYSGAALENVKLNYLSIPILLTYRPTKVLSFQAGPQFGILMNQNDNLFNNGKQAFKKGDFSVVGGVQLNLLWFKIGGRYVIGLNNINDLSNSDSWKNQGFQLYVGFRII
jgi:hypothetical protein